jgi:lipopolysaccharide/colanic/teichoic acid biosynthesis glycosyltransferase
MEDWDKFRAALLERTEPAKRRREWLVRATKILVVFATVILVIVLVVLVHERMPALVG